MNLDELREPVESLLVTDAAGHRAHENLNGANVATIRSRTIGLLQAHSLTQLLLRDGSRGIDFVTQNNEGDVTQLVGTEKTLNTSKTNIQFNTEPMKSK